MSGIYGDMLYFFSEQRISLTAYKMTPQINGGFVKDTDSDVSITGIMQNIAGKRVKDVNGNLAIGSGQELWTETGNLDAYFIQWEGDVYRLVASYEDSREGGFYRYTLEKVVGNNGTESDDASWNTGSGSFG